MYTQMVRNYPSLQLRGESGFSDIGDVSCQVIVAAAEGWRGGVEGDMLVSSPYPIGGRPTPPHAS